MISAMPSIRNSDSQSAFRRALFGDDKILWNFDSLSCSAFRALDAQMHDKEFK